MSIVKQECRLFGGALRHAGIATTVVAASAAADFVPSGSYGPNELHVFGWDQNYVEVFNEFDNGPGFPSTQSYASGGMDTSAYASPTMIGVHTNVSDPFSWTISWADVTQYFTVDVVQDVTVEWDLAGWDGYVNSVVRLHEIGVGDLVYETAATMPTGSMTFTLVPGAEYAFVGALVGVSGDGGDGDGFARITGPSGCSGDTSGDQVVDTTDLLALLGAWGTSDPLYDLTMDGVVDTADMLAMLSAWGPCT